MLSQHSAPFLLCELYFVKKQSFIFRVAIPVGHLSVLPSVTKNLDLSNQYEFVHKIRLSGVLAGGPAELF